MEKKYIDGFFVNQPRDNAPEFVLGQISIRAEQFVNFLKENVNEKGYVRIDLLRSKNGDVYAKLNEFKATAEQEEKLPIIEEEVTEVMNVEDLPF